MRSATIAPAPAALREPTVGFGEPGATRCLHCFLALSTRDRAESRSFCCSGCETVYGLIRASGLGRYYDLRNEPTAPARPLAASSSSWLESLVSSDAALAPGSIRRVTVEVQGIRCAACVWILRELFLRRAGAVDLEVNPALGRAELVWRAGECDLGGFGAELERFGYRLGPRRAGESGAMKGLLIRLGLSWAAAMNVMLFSVSYYAGLRPEAGAIYWLFGWLGLAFTLLSVATGGALFFESAWRALRRGIVHLDLPIAVGIAISAAGSIFLFFTQGPQAAYFDTVTVFIALMVLGRWLQERVLERNRRALLESDGVDGLVVRVVRAGRLETIPADALSAGDELWVTPGDLVPVESVILSERARLSLDWISGESEVRELEVGDPAPAGAWNAASEPLRARVVAPFAASRLHELLRVRVEPRGANDDPTQSFWRRYSLLYVIGVFTLSALGAALWWEEPRRAAEVAVACLIVTCPCAFGLALPLAQDLVYAGLRRRGVFVRRATLLERAPFVRRVLFDKTGTLTRDRLQLDGRSRAALRELDPFALLALYNLAACSSHPRSRAITRSIENEGFVVSLIDARGEDIPGEGVRGRIAGRAVSLGRGGDLIGGASGAATSAATGAVLAIDGQTAATFDFEEETWPDAPREVAALTREGYEVHLLSGDRSARVEALAAQLQIPQSQARGDLTPEGKAAIVAALDRGDTLMVGDGLNDGPGFDRAFCTGTPAVDRAHLSARADFYFTGEGVSAVRLVLGAARRFRKVVRANLAVALAYNVAALGFALAGRIDPVMAALLMPASSLTVVLLTLRRLSGGRVEWTS